MGLVRRRADDHAFALDHRQILIGIAMLSMYDIDAAVKELERCRKAGFGAEVTADINTALWNKLIGLATNAA